MRFLISSLAIAVSGAASAFAAEDVGDPQAGFEYARSVCSGCHGISAESSPVPEATRFREVADQPGMTGTALRVWIETYHPTMPNIVVDQPDMLNVIAYILSLKGRDADRRERAWRGGMKLVRVLVPTTRRLDRRVAAAGSGCRAFRRRAEVLILARRRWRDPSTLLQHMLVPVLTRIRRQATSPSPQHDADEKPMPSCDAEGLAGLRFTALDGRQGFVRRILGARGLMSARALDRAGQAFEVLAQGPQCLAILSTSSLSAVWFGMSASFRPSLSLLKARFVSHIGGC